MWKFQSWGQRQEDPCGSLASQPPSSAQQAPSQWEILSQKTKLSDSWRMHGLTFHLHMHTHAHTHIHTRIHAHTSTHRSTHKNTCTHIYKVQILSQAWRLTPIIPVWESEARGLQPVWGQPGLQSNLSTILRLRMRPHLKKKGVESLLCYIFSC